MSAKLFPDLMALIDSGMLAQATVRIQARQMLAVENMAETLAKLASPPQFVAPEGVDLDVEKMQRPYGYWAENRSALDRIAETLANIEVLLAHPPMGLSNTPIIARHDPSLDRYGIDPNGVWPVPQGDASDQAAAEAAQAVGPATEHEPGAASRRRRRGGDIG